MLKRLRCHPPVENEKRDRVRQTHVRALLAHMINILNTLRAPCVFDLMLENRQALCDDRQNCAAILFAPELHGLWTLWYVLSANFMVGTTYKSEKVEHQQHHKMSGKTSSF